MKFNKYTIHLCLVIVTFLNGANFSFAKILFDDFMTPNALLGFRVVFGFLLYSIFDFCINPNPKPDKNDFKMLVLCAILGIGINQFFFLKGLSITKPINASMMMLMSPIITFFLSVMFLKEKITILKILGIITACVGALLLITNGRIDFDTSQILGDFYVLINAVAWGGFVIVAVPLIKKLNVFTFLKWMFTFSFFVLVPFFYTDMVNTQFQNFTTLAWISFLYVGISATFLAYLINVLILRYVSPIVAGSYIYLQPVAASFFAVLLGKDIITNWKLLCAGIIVLGIIMVNKKFSKNNIKNESY